jgi:hypothetical protein
MPRRRKIVKQLLTSQPPSKKKKLENELIDSESKLQNSYTRSNDYQEQKAIDSIKRNPKYFFSYVKKFSKTKSAIGPLKDQDGNYISDSKDMANILSTQYSSVFSIPQNEPIDPEELFHVDSDSTKLYDIVFSPSNIIEAIEDIS